MTSWGAARRRPRSARVVRVLGAAASTAATVWLVLDAATTIGRSSTIPWTLGRASGLAAYGLLAALVTAGLLLSHPTVRRLRWPSRQARMRAHAMLAVFTLVFVVLHVVVLATDPWAHVGWPGALLPMASQYRPVGVTLGVIAAWAMVVTGVTAALAGRALGRVWWPVHKAAGAVFLLVWAHGLAAGSDSPRLVVFYLASGGAILTIALSRYLAGTTADLQDASPADGREVPALPRHDDAVGRAR